MKHFLLILFVFTTFQLTAQSSWTASSKLQSTFYGNSDSINNFFSVGSSSGYDLNYNLFDIYSPNILKQPMRTNFLVSNDSLYLIDTGKLVTQPSYFYTKTISTDTVHVVLDTNQSLFFQPLNANRYDDEYNNLFNYIGNGQFVLKDNEVKLNLGHFSLFQNKVIRYKSINYRINAITNTTVDYAPKWQSSTLLPDSAVSAPSSNDFFVNLENGKIIFYHASKLSDQCYNVNRSQITNDTMYVDLHPSKLLNAVFPLSRSANKTLALDYANSPRFEVASFNDFTDSLTIGYYHEHVFNDVSPLQSFEWVTIYKQTGNTITYTPSNLLILNVSTPVPLTKFAFYVTQTKNENQINWVTSGGENVEQFDVQKSENGQIFETIHQVKALGTSGETKYTFLDKTPFDITHYRIKMIDIDNRFTFSEVVIVKTEGNNQFNIYPNPNKGIINLEGLENTTYAIAIKSLDGRSVFSKNILAHTNSAQLDVSSLPNGIYFLNLRNLETNLISIHKINKE